MTRRLREAPDKDLLARLRVLEKKMGLVLTLVSEPVVPCITVQIPKNNSAVQSLSLGSHQRAASRRHDSLNDGLTNLSRRCV